MRIGKIIRWNDDKGYGFIKPTDGSREVFLHISAFTSRNRRPEDNELVNYELDHDAQGRPRAADVVYVVSRKQSHSPWPLLLALTFFGALAALAVADFVPFVLIGLYVVVCLITFLIYAHDKSAAMRGAWRTSESALLLFGLAGGWPGALLAQNMLRHKSRKVGFLVPFWITVLLNIVGLWWLTTPQGGELLESVIRMQ